MQHGACQAVNKKVGFLERLVPLALIRGFNPVFTCPILRGLHGIIGHPISGNGKSSKVGFQPVIIRHAANQIMPDLQLVVYYVPGVDVAAADITHMTAAILLGGKTVEVQG